MSMRSLLHASIWVSAQQQPVGLWMELLGCTPRGICNYLYCGLIAPLATVHVASISYIDGEYYTFPAPQG